MKVFHTISTSPFMMTGSDPNHIDTTITLYINDQLEALILLIHKILLSSTCFEPQVLIFRRIQLYTCSIWYCHSLWEYHMLHMYNCILLKMSTWGSKHVEESSILWINKISASSWSLIYRQFMMHNQKNIKLNNYSKTCLKQTPYIPETWTNGK